jgi:hypothetical protein
MTTTRNPPSDFGNDAISKAMRQRHAVEFDGQIATCLAEAVRNCDLIKLDAECAASRETLRAANRRSVHSAALHASAPQD